MGTQGRFKKTQALVIPNGADVSNALPSACIEDLTAALLYGPASTEGGKTFALQCNPNPEATNSTTGWVALCDGTGAGLTPPAALKAQLYSEIPHCGALRIKASGNLGSDHTWQLTGIETV